MAVFTNELFTKQDEWLTPKSAWEDIKNYIPKKQIWEAFYGSGRSAMYLRELGYDVVSESVNFFQEDMGEIIITNPPFSCLDAVFNRLQVLDKPFIMIMPSSKINTQYFRKYWKDKIQIIIPKKRIQFDKLLPSGKICEKKGACAFDCFYYCYKMDLPRDIVWL